jgi:hypothetical protein
MFMFSDVKPWGEIVVKRIEKLSPKYPIKLEFYLICTQDCQ